MTAIAPGPAFVVRDGVLYVRDWEWRSDDGVLLGVPCTTCHYDRPEEDVTAVDIRLGNGYVLTISLYPDDPEHCYAFFTSVDGMFDWTYYEERGNDRFTSDELLEMVRDFARRPPHQQEEGTP